MENVWWNGDFYTDEIKQWFHDNIDELRVVQPDAYAANLALADYLGLEVA